MGNEKKKPDFGFDELPPWFQIVIYILAMIGLLAILDPKGWYKHHDEPPTAWYE